MRMDLYCFAAAVRLFVALALAWVLACVCRRTSCRSCVLVCVVCPKMSPRAMEARGNLPVYRCKSEPQMAVEVTLIMEVCVDRQVTVYPFHDRQGITAAQTVHPNHPNCTNLEDHVLGVRNGGAVHLDHCRSIESNGCIKIRINRKLNEMESNRMAANRI